MWYIHNINAIEICLSLKELQILVTFSKKIFPIKGLK